MKMHKYSAVQRRELILELIGSREIHSQEELSELLAKRGISATQPTLSRDIRELGLAKTPVGYVTPAERTLAFPTSFVPRETLENRLANAIRDYASLIEAAGNLVILKTPPAGAQPLAHALDEAELDQVVGTIAGDDTIFLAVKTPRAAGALVKRLREMSTSTRSARRARA